MTTDIWLIDLDRSATALFELEAHTPRLSADEITRVQNVRDIARQRSLHAAYIAQRVALEAMFGADLRGVPLPRDRHGRPHLPDGMTGSVSLAHSGPVVLIGVTRHARIGVDIETARVVRMDARRRAVIEEAASGLVCVPRTIEGDARFLQAWVVLEALAKADGRGIGHLLTQLGAVGGRGGRFDAADIMQLEHGLHLSLLDVGRGRFAAVACAECTPRVLNLPHTVEGLAELLALSGD